MVTLLVLPKIKSDDGGCGVLVRPKVLATESQSSEIRRLVF